MDWTEKFALHVLRAVSGTAAWYAHYTSYAGTSFLRLDIGN